MPESTRLEVAVAAPMDTVWSALRERDELARWFGWDYDGLQPEIEEIFFAGATASAAERMLETGGGRFELVEADGGGTLVRVVREDPPGTEGWGGAYDGIDHGWLTFVQQLRFALERHPGDDRRTIHLTGDPLVLAGRPLDELGLAGVGLLEPGAAYATTLPTRERIDGEVFFAQRGQLGLTVSGWGDGLLVLFGDWTGTPPYGQVALIATTYGLEEGALAALRDGLTAWWWAHHARPT